MKKLKTAFIALLVMGLGTMVNAQDKTTTTPDPAKQADKKPAASGQHLKKDGTPDMRYKENKQATSTDKKAPAKKATPASSEKKAAPAEKKADAKPAAAKTGSKKSSTKAKADKTTK